MSEGVGVRTHTLLLLVSAALAAITIPFLVTHRPQHHASGSVDGDAAPLDSVRAGAIPQSTSTNTNVTSDSLPQNETSIAIDPTNANSILVGMNDWRDVPPGQRGGASVSIGYSTNGYEPRFLDMS